MAKLNFKLSIQLQKSFIYSAMHSSGFHIHSAIKTHTFHTRLKSVILSKGCHPTNKLCKRGFS